MCSLANTLRTVEAEGLKALKSLLRIQSVSSDSTKRSDLKRSGSFLEEMIKNWGFSTQWISSQGFPSLVAEAGPERKPTVLFYGHYDVQPALAEDGWSTDPFEPVEKEGAIFCRGASDDKGQVMAFLYGLEAYRRTYGEFPCKVRVLLEGAEEIGSPGFEELLKEKKDLIQADFAIVADCGRPVPERPAVVCGFRGLAYLEITVSGPKTDLHSGTFGGTLDNPAQVLSGMLAALKDSFRRIAVPGFYDKVEPPTEEELRCVAEVPFDEEQYKKSLGVPQLVGEEGYSTLVRRWLRPTLDINGIRAGHTGEGPKTVIPSSATAKVSARLVVNQDPEEILSLLEHFFESIAPPTCVLSFKRFAAAKPVKLDLKGQQGQWILSALQKAYGSQPLRIYDGATVPVVSTFYDLGIKPFPIGFGRIDDGAHGPNERFHLEDFKKAMAATAYLLEEIASSAS